MPTWITGDKLSPAQQREVLARYVHRHTGDHQPNWALKTKLPLQFKDDADWLANTSFLVTKGGVLSARGRYCVSRPTWPNNPELRIPLGVRMRGE